MISITCPKRVLPLAVLMALSPVATANVLEEVIVTAQKREQSIQDVGIAITAFTGDQIDKLGFSNSVDIARLTPGVFISSTSAGQNNQFTIRGVTQNDFTDSVESPNAVYVDEGYIATQNGQTFTLFDIERVEIAKGPQGTLFGRNATGGLVHYLTRKPTETLEGSADFTYGEDSTVRFEGAVGGPLGDGVAGRLALLYSSHDELLENKYTPGAPSNIGPGAIGGGEDLWGDETVAGRAHLLFTPNDDVEFLATVSAGSTEMSTGPYQSVSARSFNADGEAVIFGTPTAFDPVVSAIRTPGMTDFFGYADPDGEGFTTSQDYSYDDLNTADSFSASGKLTWDFENFVFTSITDFKSYEKFNALDVDAGPANYFAFVSESETDSFTQEFRFSGETEKTRWQTGFYFLNIDNETDTGFLFPQFSIVAGLENTDNINEIELETTSYSVFGQVEYDLTDKLVLVTGLRAIREEKDYLLKQNLYLNADDTKIDTDILLVNIQADYERDTSDPLWAGKIQLDYHASEDLLIYAGINRGVKAGSFNAPITFLTGTPESELSYDEEVLLAYELGFKSTILDGTTRVNGAVYYYDYQDYQANSFVGVSSVTTNRDATIYGAELEILSSPAEGLDLALSIGLVEAEVEDVAIAQGVVRDVEPTFTPSTTVSALVRYQFSQITMGGNVFLQTDFNYASSFFNNIRNLDVQKFDSYVVGNARIGWDSSDEKWNASLFVNNLTDETIPLVGFDLSSTQGSTIEAYGRERWYGARLRYNF